MRHSLTLLHTCARASVFGLALIANETRGHADEPRPTAARRIAVLVGSNRAAPGRTELRYAHEDARRLAQALLQAGRFAAKDVRVLTDPPAAELISALDAVAGEIAASRAETMFVFYYSGHADGQAVYPHGEALSLALLRDRVAAVHATARVGIVDTCRGGAWTQAKGFELAPPLETSLPFGVASEGSALLASSSGLENAHEAEVLGGSFFTHHLSAGLLGAADRSGDGLVTLTEAFEYAKERTVRDSARFAPRVQHPSFELNLRGRQDLVLTQVEASPSQVVVSQTRGPLEIVHASSGQTLLDLPAGERRTRLALPPGRYIVRRVEDGRALSRQVEVPAGATVPIDERELELYGSERLAMKGNEELPRTLASTPLAGQVDLRAALGASTGPLYSGLFSTSNGGRDLLQRDLSGVFVSRWALTDRLTWAILTGAFAYRFGEPGRFEAIPYAGVLGWGIGTINGFNGTLGGGADARWYVGTKTSLLFGVAGKSAFALGNSNLTYRTDRDPTRWDLSGTTSVMHTVANSATFAFGTGMTGAVGSPLTIGGHVYDNAETSPYLELGAVSSLGVTPIPLVQIHVTNNFSMDAYASWKINLQNGSVQDKYLGGVTIAF